MLVVTICNFITPPYIFRFSLEHFVFKSTTYNIALLRVLRHGEGTFRGRHVCIERTNLEVQR